MAKALSSPQRRQYVAGLSIPPSPPASPPPHSLPNVNGSLPSQHDMQKTKYPLDPYQQIRVNTTDTRAQHKKNITQSWYSQPAWRQDNPNAQPDVQHRLQQNVHLAFAMEQQREAHRWVIAAHRLASILDLANFPASVSSRLQMRSAIRPRPGVHSSMPKKAVCPSGHRYLESTGYIRSVPILTSQLDARRFVPDRARDRDSGYLLAHQISRSSGQTRQAAMERAAWDVQMLEGKESVRLLRTVDCEGENLIALLSLDMCCSSSIMILADFLGEHIDVNCSKISPKEPSRVREAMLEGKVLIKDLTMSLAHHAIRHYFNKFRRWTY